MIQNSNYAEHCKGNSFFGLDEGTQDAVIDAIATILFINTTEAKDIAETLYYEPYEECGETRVRYSLPEILMLVRFQAM